MSTGRSRALAQALLGALLLLSLAGQASGDEAPGKADVTQFLPPESVLRQFRVSREDEDWRWLLSGSEQADPFDRIKAFRLSDNGPTAGLGGEARARLESIDNPSWGLGGADQLDYWLVRARVHGDLRWDSGLRVFAAFQAADRIGSDPDPRPSIDKNSLDVQQLFVDVPLAEKSILRLGRQELSFGVGRMITARAGPINVRQPQDGARLTVDFGSSRLDAFGVRIVDVEEGAFDDSSSEGDHLYGVYWTKGRPYVSPTGIEAYLLSHERDFAIYFSGAGPEDRYSLGGRGWFQWGNWSHDIEAVYQAGDFAGGNVDAWALSTLSTRGFDGRWAPQLEIATGFNSGDRNPGDADINTFVAPLPRGGYFGAFAPFGPGNMQGARVAFSVDPTSRLSVSARVYGFWRQSTDDGLYGVSGFPLLAPIGNEKFVGMQPEIGAEFAVDRHFTLSLDVAYFDRGDFLKEVPGTSNIRSVGLTFRYQF